MSLSVVSDLLPAQTDSFSPLTSILDQKQNSVSEPSPLTLFSVAGIIRQVMALKKADRISYEPQLRGSTCGFSFTVVLAAVSKTCFGLRSLS